MIETGLAGHQTNPVYYNIVGDDHLPPAGLSDEKTTGAVPDFLGGGRPDRVALKIEALEWITPEPPPIGGALEWIWFLSPSPLRAILGALEKYSWEALLLLDYGRRNG